MQIKCDAWAGLSRSSLNLLRFPCCPAGRYTVEKSRWSSLTCLSAYRTCSNVYVNRCSKCIKYTQRAEREGNLGYHCWGDRHVFQLPYRLPSSCCAEELHWKNLPAERDDSPCCRNPISPCNWKHRAAISAGVFVVLHSETSLDKAVPSSSKKEQLKAMAGVWESLVKVAWIISARLDIIMPFAVIWPARRPLNTCLSLWSVVLFCHVAAKMYFKHC